MAKRVAHDHRAEFWAGVARRNPGKVCPTLYAELVIVGKVVGHPQGVKALRRDVQCAVQVRKVFARPYYLEPSISRRRVVSKLHLWLRHGYLPRFSVKNIASISELTETHPRFRVRQSRHYCRVN